MWKVIHKVLNTVQIVLMYLMHSEKYYKEMMYESWLLISKNLQWSKCHENTVSMKMFTEGRISHGTQQGKALFVEVTSEVDFATWAGCWQAQTDDGLPLVERAMSKWALSGKNKAGSKNGSATIQLNFKILWKKKKVEGRMEKSAVATRVSQVWSLLLGNVKLLQISE